MSESTQNPASKVKKSALLEYQELESQCESGQIDELDATVVNRHQRMLELWPAVQQECRDRYRQEIEKHSKADDRFRAIVILRELIRRLQKFGFDQKAKRLQRSLFCSDSTTVPSLLDCLRLPREGGNEFEEWQGIHDAIATFIASTFASNRPDPLKLVEELQNRLDEFDVHQTPQAHEAKASGHVEIVNTMTKTQVGAPKAVWTVEDKRIWKLVLEEKKPFAISTALKLNYDNVVAKVKALKERVKRGNQP